MNAIATEHLALACKRLGVPRLTFGSSCSVYDGLPPEVDYTEDQDMQARGAYAEAKYYAEERLRELYRMAEEMELLFVTKLTR